MGPLLLVALQLAAPAPAAPNRDVVVVARDVDTAAAALAACIARHCPPDEEARLALQLANAQFARGDYRDARATLAGSYGRTRDKAKAYPTPVADLAAGLAKVDAHLGEFDLTRLEVRRSFFIERDAYGATDPRTIARQMDMAEQVLSAGDWKQGVASLEDAVGAADRNGSPELKAQSRIRLASAMLKQKKLGDLRQRVPAILAPVLATPGAEYEGYRAAARALNAKLAAQYGDKDALQRETAKIASIYPAPVLISAQPIAPQRSEAEDQCHSDPYNQLCNPDNLTANQNFERQWIDVEFTIDAAGAIKDISITRDSGRIDGDWPKRVLASVQTRRYSAAAGRPDVIKRERYTMTGEWDTNGATRVRSRLPHEVIERIDMSDDAPAYLKATDTQAR